MRGLPLVARFVGAAPLRTLVARAIRRHDLDHWLVALDRQQVPVAPVLTVTEALADPQIVARTHGLGRLGAPAALVTEPPGVAPRLGEHTSELLAALA